MGADILGGLPEFGFQGAFYIVIISFLIFVGFVLFWIAGRVQEHIEFEGKRICKMRITIQGRGTIEANLAHNESFDDNILDKFENMTETKVIKGVLDQLKKDKKIFICNAKLTDDGNMDEDFADKIRIISAIPFWTDLYSWEDEQIKRPFLKFWKAEGYRNCVFLKYPLSQKVRIYNEDSKENEDYWIVAPLDAPDGKKYNTLRDNPFPDAPVHVFTMNKIDGGVGLAKLASIAKTFAKALEYNESLKTERDTYMELHDELLHKYEDVHVDLQDTKEDLAQKEYIVSGKEAYKKQQTLGAFWIVLSAIASGFMSLMMLALFPESDLEFMVIVGMITGLLITGGGFMFYMSRVKPVERMRMNDLDG